MAIAFHNAKSMLIVLPTLHVMLEVVPHNVSQTRIVLLETLV
jgi:hypothetical protein